MPNKKLVVIYGKNDPDKDCIISLANKSKNIKFLTLVPNKDFLDYIGNAIATIYIPIDEDFGMSPVESMAAGKPVLGVNEGGLKETIIDKNTGVLIDSGAEIEDIINAVEYLTAEKCLSMRNNCEKRAKEFSLDNFDKKLKIIIGK